MITLGLVLRQSTVNYSMIAIESWPICMPGRILFKLEYTCSLHMKIAKNRFLKSCHLLRTNLPREKKKNERKPELLKWQIIIKKRYLSWILMFLFIYFSGSKAPDLFQEMVSASWCGILASLSLLLEARYWIAQYFDWKTHKPIVALRKPLWRDPLA